MAGIVSPTPIFQGFAGNGQFLVGGQLFTYQAGTNIPAATYVDSTLSTPNTNPVILNAYGQASVWLNPGVAYKYVLEDAAGNTLYTKDNINVAVTPQNYPQTPAEITAGVIPANTSFPAGDFRRYGADPLGNTDSAPALAQAQSCNAYIFDGYPGGGNYILNSQVVLTNYPQTIQGQSKNIGSLPTGGTRITLQAVAGAAASIFTTTSFFTGLNIDRLSFQWQNPALAQFGFRAQSDLRGFVISNNSFVNSAGGIPGATGIELQGASTFTGAGAIRDNYMAALLNGIQLGGTCTTVKVRDNEIYGNLAGANNGIALSSGCIGVSVIGNTLEGWNAGIFNAGNGIVQVGNYFEGNVIDFQWTTGGANSSFGDRYVGSGSPNAVYPALNGTTGTLIWGGSFGNFADSNSAEAWRGFNELGQGANLGYFTTVPPVMVANGGGTLSSIVPTTFGYSRIGGLMIVQFNISATLAGAATTAIQITIPQGLFCVGANLNTCQILNAGSTAAGVVDAVGTQINIGPIGGGNWTAGAIQVNGSVPIRIIS